MIESIGKEAEAQVYLGQRDRGLIQLVTADLDIDLQVTQLEAPNISRRYKHGVNKDLYCELTEE